MKLVPRLLSLGLVLPLGGLVLSVFLAGELFRRALVEDVDQRLLAQAAVESVSFFDGPDRKPHIHLPRSPLAREVEAFPTTSALYDPAGLLLQTSPEGALVPRTLVLDPPSLRPQIRTSGGARTLLVSVDRAGEGAYTLYLSASLAPTFTAMSLFYRVVGGTVSLIGLLLAALLYHQARWLSSRLRELISAVSWLRESRPHPGPIAPGNDELAELGQVLVEASHHIYEQQASVRVSAERRGASLRVTIEDQGPGVPEEERSRLFLPFHRGAAAGSQTGLGLAFAAEVLRRHSGSITLAPHPPPGTTFLLEIPALMDR